MSLNRRQLIVNADDFGISQRTNAGIVQCRRQGILTSASLLVRADAAIEAVKLWRADAGKCPEFSLGLHLDLGEWELKNGDWEPIYLRADLNDMQSVKREIDHQLNLFRQLSGANPTHVDSHQHVHQKPGIQQVVRELANQLGVPLRDADNRVRFWGGFFGRNEHFQPMTENIRPDNLKAILKALLPGITELSCHPGLDSELQSDYCTERLIEVQTLCDPEIQRLILQSGIELVSYCDLRTAKVEQ